MTDVELDTRVTSLEKNAGYGNASNGNKIYTFKCFYSIVVNITEKNYFSLDEIYHHHVETLLVSSMAFIYNLSPINEVVGR